MRPLTDSDRKLVEAAEEVLRVHDNPARHTTGAAVRADSGRIYTGLSLKAGTSQSDVHAEPVAIARAILEEESGFETVAAVQFEGDEETGSRRPVVVTACGSCRELLSKQAPDIQIVVPSGESLEKRPIQSLLPDRTASEPI